MLLFCCVEVEAGAYTYVPFMLYKNWLYDTMSDFIPALYGENSTYAVRQQTLRCRAEMQIVLNLL